MRLALVAIIAIVSLSEAYAQRAPRGPRYNPPGQSRDRVVVRPNGRVVVRDNRRDDRVVVRPNGNVVVRDYDSRVVYRPNGRVVVTPRRTYRPGRVYREYRRSPIIWSVPFGYSCSMYGDLMLNGRPIHNFRYSMDCHDAISDIRLYGDYCDDDTMYDQSGFMEAQFSSRYECREALGWYY